MKTNQLPQKSDSLLGRAFCHGRIAIVLTGILLMSAVNLSQAVLPKEPPRPNQQTVRTNSTQVSNPAVAPPESASVVTTNADAPPAIPVEEKSDSPGGVPPTAIVIAAAVILLTLIWLFSRRKPQK
jgi:hypothetical protein